MDSNALYYLFSTTAQTVAAATGFLAAFVLLRLQQWDGEMSEAEANLKPWAKEVGDHLSSMYDIFKECDTKKSEAAIAEFKIKFGMSATACNELMLRMRVFLRLLPNRTKLIEDFWAAILPATITIGTSLVLIPFTPPISKFSFAAWFAVVVILCCCSWTIWKIYSLLHHALDLPKPAVLIDFFRD